MAEEYIKARKAGLKTRNRRIAMGEFPNLPALEYIVPEIGRLPRESLGTMEIPLSQVIGTYYISRNNSFAWDFMPILDTGSEFAAKWNNLYEIQIREGIRDAVKVVEFMRRFYVIEGNKRVSVLRYIGVPVILADVTRILPKRSADPEVTHYYEFLEFYSAAPIYEIECTWPGGYRYLAHLLGISLDRPCTDEELLDIKSAYSRFENAYSSLTAPRPLLTSGDALLWYLGIYGYRSLLTDTPEEIAGKAQKLRGEFLTSANEDNMFLVNGPDKDYCSLLEKVKLPRKASYTEENPMRAAFLYDRDIKTSGWNFTHELGRLKLENELGGIVLTDAYEHCEETEAFDRAVEAAAAAGTKIIISTSPRQIQDALRAAIRFPEMHFLNCSVLPRHEVRTFYPRMYEVKFLMGMLAASICEDHKIAYRADYPIQVTIANINAFAIGAAMVDPKARIFLKWSTLKGRDWESEVREEGISIISDQDYIFKEKAKKKIGLYKREKDGSITNLAVPVWDWGVFYGSMIQDVLDGTAGLKIKQKEDQSITYWWGLGSGLIDIVLSDHLSPYTKRFIGTARQAVAANYIQPFEGRICSQTGCIKSEEDSPLSALEIMRMDWLNENVVGEIPLFSDLVEWVQRTVRVCGIVREEQT